MIPFRYESDFSYMEKAERLAQITTSTTSAAPPCVLSCGW
jgi:hypothetical protein